MIISVRDAQNNLSDGAAITALLAGMTAVGKSKNTLVLQFTENQKVSIIDVLAGHAIKQNQIRDAYSFVDDGLDALFLRAESTDLAKEHYDECVTPLLEKENMLDVLKPVKTSRIGDIVSLEVLDNVLKHAEDVYDYIYVLIPNDDEKLVDLVTECTKEDLIIIPQGEMVSIDTSNGKTYVVVKDFESTSKFDIASIKKRYGIKKVYTVPHNVGFKDSILEQTLLDFILINKKLMKEDDNYSFHSSLLSLISRYVSDKYDDDEFEVKLAEKEKGVPAYQQPEDIDILPEEAVQEVVVKKKLFRKKKSKIMINL